MACALLVSAIIASSAQAAATAFTCSEKAVVKPYTDSHCQNKGIPETFGHVAFGNTPTTLGGTAGTSFGGEQRLRATINGINTELATTTVTGTGELEENTGGTVKGSGTITYTGVKVVAPAGKECKVYTDNGGVKGEEGVVHTNKLSASTTNPTELKFTPAAGEVFAAFIIDGCKGSEALEGLNKTYTVNGSVVGTVNGVETSATHAGVTAQNTLKVNGTIKAGLNGALTIKGENPTDATDELTGLTLT
jgi:hypothetical protein